MDGLYGWLEGSHQAVLKANMKLYEQADKTGDKVTYSWLLEAPYNMRGRLVDWKWVKGVGGKGCYVTNNLLLAIVTARRFGLGKPISNGTHGSVKAEMSSFS